MVMGFDSDKDGDHLMKEGLSTTKEIPWKAKHNPVNTFL